PLFPYTTLFRSEGNAAPMVGASAQHPRPPPHPFAARRTRVGLALNLPAAVDRSIKIAEWLIGRRCPSMRRVVTPFHHLRFFCRIEPPSRFEDQALGAGFGEYVGGDAATGARTDNDRVIGFRARQY